MYVCMLVFMHLCVHVCTCACIYAFESMCAHVCIIYDICVQNCRSSKEVLQVRKQPEEVALLNGIGGLWIFSTVLKSVEQSLRITHVI